MKSDKVIMLCFGVFGITAITGIVLHPKPTSAKPKSNPCAWFSQSHTLSRHGSYMGSHPASVACTKNICVACTKKGTTTLDCRQFNPSSCFK